MKHFKFVGTIIIFYFILFLIFFWGRGVYLKLNVILRGLKMGYKKEKYF